jgi:mono/diheme cytochrome c family protein
MKARVVLALLVLCACDDRDALRTPQPTLARMLDQRRGDPFSASSAFPDGKTMREPPRGTVAHDADEEPPAVTRELLALGRTRFERTCAACHGVAGDGRTVVASKMMHRPPPSLHEPRIRAFGRAQLFTVMTDGYGLMPSYAGMLTSTERWAVAAYVKALQLALAAPQERP